MALVRILALEQDVYQVTGQGFWKKPYNDRYLWLSAFPLTVTLGKLIPLSEPQFALLFYELLLESVPSLPIVLFSRKCPGLG